MTCRSWIGVCLGLLCLAGCTTSEDARVLQVLNQRGFGRPTYDANRQYYVGIGDSVVVRDTMHIEYNGVSEQVRMDGVITLPDVGEVYVNGLTPEEMTQVVRLRYEEYVNDTSGLSVEVSLISSKRYYITGIPPRSPRSVDFRGDVTLLDALLTAQMNEHLIATDEIMVIRGDPEDPLEISCNYDAIKQRGFTRDNIQVRENDIIYLTPSWIGYVAYFVDALLAPLTPIQQFITGADRIVRTTDSFGQGNSGGNNYNNNNNF